jgi:hypothetical protein
MNIKSLLSTSLSRSTSLTILVSGAAGSFITFSIFTWLLPFLSAPTPVPLHPYDPKFVAIGSTYLTQLGNAYARAWQQGAASLDSGSGLSTAIDNVKQAWETNRLKLFDEVATPAFNHLVPQDTKDTDLTASARAALAAAWRGFAKGLQR